MKKISKTDFINTLQELLEILNYSVVCIKEKGYKNFYLRDNTDDRQVLIVEIGDILDNISTKIDMLIQDAETPDEYDQFEDLNHDYEILKNELTLYDLFLEDIRSYEQNLAKLDYKYNPNDSDNLIYYKKQVSLNTIIDYVEDEIQDAIREDSNVKTFVEIIINPTDELIQKVGRIEFSNGDIQNISDIPFTFSEINSLQNIVNYENIQANNDAEENYNDKIKELQAENNIGRIKFQLHERQTKPIRYYSQKDYYTIVVQQGEADTLPIIDVLLTDDEETAVTFAKAEANDICGYDGLSAVTVYDPDGEEVDTFE